MKSGKAKARVRVWTLLPHSPFALGGGSPKVIAAEVVPEQTFEASGFTLHVIKNAKTGHFHIAEGETGAFVQHGKTDAEAISNVTRDLSTADPTIVRGQLEGARAKAKSARVLEPEVFWSKFGG
jgi:hypothetical protein